MANTYVSFISDQHFKYCVGVLFQAYVRAKSDINKERFYSNKIDVIKLTFDFKFHGLSEDEMVKREIDRQIDKSITNAIGTFHEMILGGINGYERGILSGYDIKATDNTLFADIKNKHNTMNSGASESLYQKLARFADQFPDSRCYWVKILSPNSLENLWIGRYGARRYGHSRVYEISGDRFYAKLSGERDALANLYKALPKVIDDFIASLSPQALQAESTAFTTITKEAARFRRSVLDQISYENFSHYNGFDSI